MIINVERVLNAGAQANSAQNTVTDVMTSMESLRKSISSDVLNRNNNKQMIDRIISGLSDAASRIRSIRISVDNMANAYYSTDAAIQKNEETLNSVQHRLTSGSNDSAFT